VAKGAGYLLNGASLVHLSAPVHEIDGLCGRSRTVRITLTVLPPAAA
jgi:hypothetical protein